METPIALVVDDRRRNGLNDRQITYELKEAGLSDRAIALAFGVSESTVRNWRTGRTTPMTDRRKNVSKERPE